MAATGQGRWLALTVALPAAGAVAALVLADGGRIVVAAVVLAVAVLAGIVTATRVARSLAATRDTMQRAADALTSGDLRTAAGAEADGLDAAVRELAGSLQPMKPAIDLLDVASVEINHAGAAVTTGMRQAADAASTIAASTRSVPADAEAMQEAGQTILTSVTDIARQATEASATARSHEEVAAALAAH